MKDSSYFYPKPQGGPNSEKPEVLLSWNILDVGYPHLKIYRKMLKI